MIIMIFFTIKNSDHFLLFFCPPSLTTVKHRWFSGRIIAFQAVDPGSIPGRCIFITPFFYHVNYEDINQSASSSCHCLHSCTGTCTPLPLDGGPNCICAHRGTSMALFSTCPSGSTVFYHTMTGFSLCRTPSPF